MRTQYREVPAVPAACPHDDPAVGALPERGGWHGHPPGVNALSPTNRIAVEDRHFKGKLNKHVVTVLSLLKPVVIFKCHRTILSYSCSFSSRLIICQNHNRRRKAIVFSGLQSPQDAISFPSDILSSFPSPIPDTDITGSIATF